MKKLLILTAVGLLAAGGGNETSGTIEGEDGQKVDYAVSQEGGETNVTMKSEDGTVNVQSGANVAVDLPMGFSLYPGAKVVSNTKVAQADGSGALLVLESSASAADMVGFYRKQAESAGIKIAMEMNTNGTQMIAGESADGKSTFSFTATPGGDTTTAQLTVGAGM